MILNRIAARSISLLCKNPAALMLLVLLIALSGCTKSRQTEQPAPVDTTPEIFVALGHSSNVTSLAFSPDARFALSGSEDHTVKLWDLTARKLVRTWQGQRLGIRGSGRIRTDFSPDGRRFLAMSWDGDVVIVDLASGRTIAAFVHPSMAFARFSPNGDYLLTGSYQGDVKLWSIADREESQSYELSSYGVTAGVFVGSRVVCGDYHGHLHLLDLAKEERLSSTQEDGPAIFVLESAPDGSRVVSVNSAGTVAAVDARTLTELRRFSTGFHLTGPSAAVSRDARFAVVQGSPVGNIPLWDVANGQPVKTLRGSGGLVDAVSFSPDGSQLIAAGIDNTIDLFDLTTTERLITFPGQNRRAKAAACSPDGSTLLSASVEWFGAANIMISRWDAGHGLLGKQLAIPTSFDISFSPDLGSGFSRKTGWNLEKGTKDVEVLFDGEPEISVYSPDGRRLLTGDLQANVKLFELPTGRQLLAFKAHEDQLRTVAFSRDGSLFATGSNTNEDNLKVWDAVDGHLVRAFSQNTEFINVVAFLPDGRHILTGPPSSPAVMKLWDISTGAVVREFPGHMDEIHTIAVSRDGRFAVSAGKDTEVKMWDIATGQELRTFSGHADDVHAVAVSDDGRRIVSVADDGTTRLWDVARGVELASFFAFEDGEWVVMVPDGHFNSSSRGAKYLNVRIGNEVYSADNFFESFFDPLRVAAALGGAEAAPAPAADIRKGVLPPPRVRILSPAANTTRATDTVTVAVSAIDMGGGVEEIRLYHNGKEIGGDTRGMRPIVRANETVRTFVPTLVEGLNTFRAVAYSRDRTESHAVEVTVMLEAPRQEASLHVLTVGINEYKNRALNLNFAQPDAEAIAAFFRRSGGRLFRTVTVREVYNDQATKEGILTAIAGLRGSRPQDAVVIYLAGHGESIGERWYFLPHELTYPEREDEVRSRGLSSDELRGAMREVPAQKILLLIDACKSGAVLVAFRGFEDRKALSQLSRATGVHIVAASTKDQFAAEVKELGHGVFTYTLLAGLNGQAARTNEPVTVRKLMGYVEETLPGLTKKYKQEAQYPVVDSRGMDFPLVLVR